MARQVMINRLFMLLSRTAMFAVLWWLLTEGQPGSWGLGVPAVLLATLVSLLLVPRMTISIPALLRFIPFFLRHSLEGGMDVAGRALHSRLPITPVLVDYPLKLPEGLPRVVMINMVSLLPGTLSVEIDNDGLRVHVLDGNSDITVRLGILECRVAELFALAMTPTVSDHSLT
ncbi:Na+/H+ antiporter subunit E [Thiohalophilus sp.]|uniref:Na+/H+ antiporter subunit E n=1 Tax=Thiohalophilus sp. TaxID=3028392 RepID=UPI002ACDE99C|nr:Na+/H+ antiporter subunit E [Thiohalophilus sp.]MDZ7803915.1 Na+/H+ antiporter subunit E [Thiohalophilus sp.]